MELSSLLVKDRKSSIFHIPMATLPKYFISPQISPMPFVIHPHARHCLTPNNAINNSPHVSRLTAWTHAHIFANGHQERGCSNPSTPIALFTSYDDGRPCTFRQSLIVLLVVLPAACPTPQYHRRRNYHVSGAVPCSLPSSFSTLEPTGCSFTPSMTSSHDIDINIDEWC